MKKIIIMLLLLSTFVFLSVGVLYAQDYPSKPVNYILQFGPGGGGDQIAQALKPRFKEITGQALVVQYRPGASAQIGYEILDSLPADGYNMGFLTTPHLQLTILTQEPNYEIDSFYPLGTHHMDSVIFYAAKDTNYNDINDVVEDARKRPGKVKVAVGSIKSDMGVAIKALEQAAGVEFAIIPTGGGGAVLSGTLGKHFDVGVHRPTSALGSKDELKGLGILTKTRDSNWPDTPTFNEALPNDIKVPIIGTWRGACVKKEVKENYPERFETLVEVYKNIVTSEEYKEIAKNYGWNLEYHTPEETMELIYEDLELMTQFVDLLE